MERSENWYRRMFERFGDDDLDPSAPMKLVTVRKGSEERIYVAAGDPSEVEQAGARRRAMAGSG